MRATVMALSPDPTQEPGAYHHEKSLVDYTLTGGIFTAQKHPVDFGVMDVTIQALPFLVPLARHGGFTHDDVVAPRLIIKLYCSSLRFLL